MPIPTEQERIGTLVAGRYRIEALIGRGGSGFVFRAVHTWTGRNVAIKLLRPEYARDLSLVRRFLQEARTAAGLKHPNVVDVLDMGADEDGTVYLALELLEGISLRRKLKLETSLSLRESLSILKPIIEALCDAHDKGIIHRDLKPDNIFLARDGSGREVPKLLDFGMARMVESAWGTATQSGTLIGTPFYMSPEQAEGMPNLGPSTDVWSMGVIFYECLSGELPFRANTPTGLLLKIVRERPMPLHDRAPYVPEAVCDVVDRAMAADPSRRFQTMTDFEMALSAAVAEPEGLSSGRRKVRRVSNLRKFVHTRTFRRLVWMSGAALLGGASIMAGLSLVASPATPEEAVRVGAGTPQAPSKSARVRRTNPSEAPKPSMPFPLEPATSDEPPAGREETRERETPTEPEASSHHPAEEPEASSASSRATNGSNSPEQRPAQQEARPRTLPDLATEW